MLAVAALYSITAVAGKRTLDYASPIFMGPAYFALLGFAALGLFSIKNPSAIRVLWRRPVQHLMVGGMMAVMAITHFTAVEKVEVAYMMSVKRTSMLFGVLYGAWLFGEKHLARHGVGALMMLGGVALLFID